MQVKRASVPVYNVQLSNLEASAALHACRECESKLEGLAEELTPFEKAALAFSKSFQNLLLKQGADWKLPEVFERYPSGSKRGVQRALSPSPAKAPQKPAPASKSTEEEPSFEKQMEDLIAEDQELLE